VVAQVIFGKDITQMLHVCGHQEGALTGCPLIDAEDKKEI
jgi:hypothetical protein